MSKRKTQTAQRNALGNASLPIVSFDASKLDYFITTHGVDWCLFTATPSVVGMIDKGDYRRPNQVDTISSNGYIYKKAGTFTGVLTSNSKSQSFGDMGGLVSQASGRVIMPRFFNKNCELAKGERIYPCVGDRIYKNGAEKDSDLWVINFQRVDYDFGEDSKAQFPIKKVVSLNISTGEELVNGVDFLVTQDGDIRWIAGGRNPGLNPNTQTGLPFSIRYLYTPFFYISALPHELRLTSSIVSDGVNDTVRLPYFLDVLREYLYQDQTNNGRPNNPPSQSLNREPERPSAPITGHSPIKVSISDIMNE